MNRQGFQKFVAFAALFSFVPACKQEPSGGPPNGNDTGLVAAAVPVAIVDRLKRTVQSSPSAERIVSLSPATTELLFALGLGDQVVGATKHCNHPARAVDIPRVGGGLLESISVETIVSLKPDLVLCKWDTHQPLLDNLERLNIRVCAVGAQNLDELYEETHWVGQLANRSAEATDLISKMRSRHSELLSLVDDVRTEPPLSVFYEVWDDPLMTAAPNSFIGELLSMAALENIVSDTSVRYPRISAETVIDGDPDLILAPTTHFENVEIESFRSRPGWSAISAVANERIHLISGDEVSRCGPRLLEALAEIILVAYPESAGRIGSESSERQVAP
ncbi:MAG: helical backbone metal receptor [Planctomycetota bacterium]